MDNACVLLRELVRTSDAVAAAPGRRAKVEEIAALLRRAAPAEVPVAVACLAGELRQRQIGVGYPALGPLLRAALPATQPAAAGEGDLAGTAGEGDLPGTPGGRHS